MSIRSKLLSYSCCCWLTIAALSCGCQQVEQQTCSPQLQPTMIAPVPPDVIVIGHEAPREHRATLAALTNEIRNSLSMLGGLHLLDSPTVVLDPPCEIPAQPIGGIQPVAFTEFHSAPMMPQTIYPGEQAADYPPNRYEIRISISEFLVYRPMRLAGTITVHDTSTGVVVRTIQDTWYAPKDCEPLADASCALQQTLQRPPPAGHMEVDAMAMLSPQRFLYQIAKKVAPQIRSACLPCRCATQFNGQ